MSCGDDHWHGTCVAVLMCHINIFRRLELKLSNFLNYVELNQIRKWNEIELLFLTLFGTFFMFWPLTIPPSAPYFFPILFCMFYYNYPSLTFLQVSSTIIITILSSTSDINHKHWLLTSESSKKFHHCLLSW